MALVTDDQISHYQQKLQYEIDSWDLYEAFAKGENIVVLDVRSAEAFNEEHIPNATNFPHRTINQDTAAESLDLNLQYVTYCDGVGCNASTKAALKLAKLGYKVKELIGGLDWWVRDGYSTVSLEDAEPHEHDHACGC